MKGHCILSHGFESGPDATKVTALAAVAESLGWTCERPDYTAFDAQTEVTKLGNVDARKAFLLERAMQWIEQNKGPLVLAGSSLGSFISGLTSLKVEVAGLFLLAPPIFDGEDYKLDAADIPTWIIHGWDDELIPYQQVIDWAHPRRARVLLVNDTHRLSDHVKAGADQFRQFLESL